MKHLERDNVIKTIRALLISAKYGVDINRLYDDYYNFTHDFIPYTELGHKTLKEFLYTIPSIIVEKVGHDFIACAVPVESSKHVFNMVTHQSSQGCASNVNHNQMKAIQKTREMIVAGRPENYLRDVKPIKTVICEPSFNRQSIRTKRGTNASTTQIKENDVFRGRQDFGSNQKIQINNNLAGRAKNPQLIEKKKEVVQWLRSSSPQKLCVEDELSSDALQVSPAIDIRVEGPEPYALGTFRAKLVKLTAERNWPQPVYYVIRTRCFSSQRITCISIVSIRCPMEPYKNGDFIFSSFPHKFDCAGESKDEASRKAFSDLSPLASAFYIESDTQTDPSIVTSRILEIICRLNKDLWICQIAEEYRRRYGERFPDNYVELLINTPVHLENVDCIHLVQKLPTKTRIDIMKKLHDGDKALRKERDKAKYKTFKVSRGKSATENNRQAENMHPQSEKKSEPCLRGLGRGRGRIFTVLKEKELEMKQLEVKPEQTEEKKYDVERRKRRDAKRIAYMKEHNLLDPNKEYGDIFDSDDPYYDYDTTPDSSDIFFKYF